jgi:sec-independent protein translocase protein TatA
MTIPSTLAFIQNIGMTEWIIILVIMLLLFGRRLPEVGKSLGKGIVEFKKGLKGVEDEIEQRSSQPQQPWQQPPVQGWQQPAAPAAQQQWQQQPPQNLPPGAPPPPPVMGQPGTVSRADAAQPS